MDLGEVLNIGESGARERHPIALRARLLQRLAVHPVPIHREVVAALVRDASVGVHRVERHVLAEVRHPAVDAIGRHDARQRLANVVRRFGPREIGMRASLWDVGHLRVAVGLPAFPFDEQPRLIHRVEALLEPRWVVFLGDTRRIDDEGVDVDEELVATVVEVRHQAAEVRVANVFGAAAGFLRLPQVLNAEASLEVRTNPGPVLDPERRSWNACGFERISLRDHHIGAALGRQPQVVGPSRRLRRPADEVAELPDDIERRGAVENAPPDRPAGDDLEPSDVFVGLTQVDVEPRFGVEEHAETAHVDVVRHGEVGRVLVPGVRQAAAIAADSLLVDEQGKRFATLIDRVVLHPEPVEGAELVAADADRPRIGGISRNGELELAHFVAHRRRRQSRTA